MGCESNQRIWDGTSQIIVILCKLSWRHGQKLKVNEAGRIEMGLENITGSNILMGGMMK